MDWDVELALMSHGVEEDDHEACAGAAGGFLSPMGPAPIATVARLGPILRSHTLCVDLLPLLVPSASPNANRNANETAVAFLQVDVGACTLRARARSSSVQCPPPASKSDV